MIRLTHSSPRRTLRHLRKLQRDGEALLDRQSELEAPDSASWEVRLWRCLDRLTAPGSFDGAVTLDNAEAGPVDLLDFAQPTISAAELDQLLRRRMSRRIVTLASVIEKVEALCESGHAGPPTGAP